MERNKSIHLVKQTNSSLTYKVIKDGTEKLHEESLEAMDIFTEDFFFQGCYDITLHWEFKVHLSRI